MAIKDKLSKLAVEMSASTFAEIVETWRKRGVDKDYGWMLIEYDTHYHEYSPVYVDKGEKLNGYLEKYELSNRHKLKEVHDLQVGVRTMAGEARCDGCGKDHIVKLIGVPTLIDLIDKWSLRLVYTADDEAAEATVQCMRDLQEVLRKES